MCSLHGFNYSFFVVGCASEFSLRYGREDSWHLKPSSSTARSFLKDAEQVNHY